MKADFSRNTFDPEKQYRRVLMQQGRVQVDADWNEQSEIEKNLQERITESIIGQHGGPAVGPNAADSGFYILDDGGVWKITPGDYFVDGIMIGNPESIALDNQPFPHDDDLPQGNGGYLVYVEVRERYISPIAEGHEQMVEVALNGADTCARTQYVWQVKWTELPEGTDPKTCIEELDTWNDLIATEESKGLLSARSHQPPESATPCIVKESGGYRGLQNHLYRIEVHQGGAMGNAQFKWSRDNGSVQARWIGIQAADELIIDEAGKDQYLQLAGEQWIELIDEARILNGEAGTLVKIDNAEGNILFIDTATATGTVNFGDFDNPIVRRWDCDGLATIEQAANNDGYLKIEDGIEIRFDLQVDAAFKTGDYWLIPARTAIADIEWPIDEANNLPKQLAPKGIARHYAPLGLLFLNTNTFEDRRLLFSPLTDNTVMYYLSGDTQEALPALPNGDPAGKVPHDLKVGVANGDQPIANAPVHFRVTQGQSQFTAGPQVGDNIVVHTNNEGIASVSWQLDPNQNQPFHIAEAQLLTNCEQDKHLPITFTARLNLASHVFYSDPSCANLNQEPTVDAALKTLSRLTSMQYVGGDGQEFTSGEWLPQRLEASVRNQCGPVANARIRFEAPQGSRLALTAADFPAANSNSIEAVTDATGIASCFWRPQSIAGVDSLECVATLTGAAGHPIAQPAVLHFSTREQPAGGDGYPPTVGNGGFYPTLDIALQQLKGKEVINLYLLPQDHVIDRAEAIATRTIKIVGAGNQASRIRLKEALLFQSNELILRDLMITNDTRSDSPRVVIDARQIDIEGTIMARVSSSSEFPFIRVGNAKVQTASTLSINDSQLIAYTQKNSIPPTPDRFLLNTNTPSALRPKLNAFYRMDLEADPAGVKKASEELAQEIRKLSRNTRVKWARANESSTPTRGLSARLMEITDRFERPISTARFLSDDSAFVDSESLHHLDLSALDGQNRRETNKVISDGLFNTIKSVQPSIKAISEGLLNLAAAQIERSVDDVIELVHNGIGGAFTNNKVFGRIILFSVFPKLRQEEFNKETLRRPFEAGADIAFHDNQILQLICHGEPTNRENPKSSPLSVYANAHFSNNRFKAIQNIILANNVLMTGNKFEGIGDLFYCLAVNAVYSANIADQNSDNPPTRIRSIVKGQSNESANIPFTLIQ